MNNKPKKLPDISQGIRVSGLMLLYVQGSFIMKNVDQSDASDGVQSAVQYLMLAIAAAERLKCDAMIPVSTANVLLAHIQSLPTDISPHSSPPPLTVTSVSFEEEQRRTRPLRVGSNPMPTYAKPNPPNNPPPTIMRDAGRGWHHGM